MTPDAQRALRELEQHGLLLLADQRLPSLVTVVVGAPIRGSWWGHPLGALIFQASEALEQDPDVLAIKLVAGKVTFVHRRLWPALATVATAREPWQVDGLSKGARALLERVERQGEVRASGDAARELEARLLAVGSQVHTEKGRHEKRLESWERWMERARLSRPLLSAERARAELEAALAGINARSGARAVFPWEVPRHRPRAAR